MRDPAVGPGFDDQSATPKKEGNPFGLPSFIAPAGVSRKADSNVDTSDTTQVYWVNRYCPNTTPVAAKATQSEIYAVIPRSASALISM